MINYGQQEITDADIAAVVDVLKSDFLTQGPVVGRFERSVAEKVGATDAIAVNSATSALHIACLALGLGSGDLLWTSPISFVASANCALYCGATVDFVDIDSSTFNLSIAKLEEKLRKAEITGTLPKILVPVHLCGQSCDMRKIKELSLRYGFRILEDASHAVGGTYENKYIGSCQYSDVTVFSFHPVKIITTGEGGMALTNDVELAEKMRLLRSHGITRDVDKFESSALESGPWYYQQVELGFNYRITDIQAALGLSQLDRLDQFVSTRNALSKIYNSAFEGSLKIKSPVVSPNRVSSFHLYVVEIDFSKNLSKQELFCRMKKNGINLNCHYIPIHLQPFYANRGFNFGDFPAAESYYAKAVTLPLHPSLTENQIEFVIEQLNCALD